MSNINCRTCNNKPCTIYSILTKNYISDGSLNQEDFNILIIDIAKKCITYIPLTINNL